MALGPSSLVPFRLLGVVAVAVACCSTHADASSRHQTVHATVGAADGSGRVATPGAPVIVGPTEPRSSFTEALVSVNADVPAGAIASVDMRIRDTDGAWSPWLFVMDWSGQGGSLRSAPKITESSLGRVDVDYFKSARPMSAAQVRITAEGGAVEVSSVALTFTSAAPSDDGHAGIPVGRAVEPVELAVPFRSQRAEDPTIAGRICSPTSVAMVLEYHGITVPTQHAADTIYDPRHDLFGNWPRAVQGAYAFGAPGYLTRFDRWDAVRETLASGSPIIASIRVRAGQLDAAPYPSTAGHLIVITGLDGEGNVIVNDCAATTPDAGKRLLYPMADMETVWFAGSNGTAYVLTPPGSEHR